MSPVGVQGADVAGFGLWEAFFGEGDGPLAGVYGAMVFAASQRQILHRRFPAGTPMDHMMGITP